MTTKLLPALAGATGMVFVGGSVAVSGLLADAPSATVQSLRYAVACLLLLAYARLSAGGLPRRGARLSGGGLVRPTGARSSGGGLVRPAGVRSSGAGGVRRLGARSFGGGLVRPRGVEWLWLAGVVLTGMVFFNVALVQGARHAEPAVLGVAVACVPLLLAVVGPLLEGRTPAARVITAALVVTAGAALVQGFGRTDGVGLRWALVTFACEAGFTLLAVPVLGRHGPLGVSVHATWMAAAAFGVGGLILEGPGAVLRLHTDDVLAGVYLAVAVTAVAFVLWYTCVQRLGSARAGLLTGIAPISAALVGIAVGGPVPGFPVWLGVGVVAAGLALGLRPAKSPAPVVPIEDAALLLAPSLPTRPG